MLLQLTLTSGAGRCVCKPGFKHRGRSCVDIDECAEIPNICSHECANLWGSYRCHCRQGYTLAEDRRTCEDEDECESAGQCQGECHNQPGSFRCSCPPGYSLASNGRTCEDVDECAEAGEPAACTAPGTQCHNTRGGFKCVDMKVSVPTANPMTHYYTNLLHCVFMLTSALLATDAKIPTATDARESTLDVGQQTSHVSGNDHCFNPGTSNIGCGKGNPCRCLST